MGSAHRSTKSPVLVPQHFSSTSADTWDMLGWWLRRGQQERKVRETGRTQLRPYGTQGLGWPDDKLWGSEPGASNQISLCYWSQAVWPQCTPYVSTNETYWKAGSAENGACIKILDMLRMARRTGVINFFVVFWQLYPQHYIYICRCTQGLNANQSQLSRIIGYV